TQKKGEDLMRERDLLFPPGLGRNSAVQRQSRAKSEADRGTQPIANSQDAGVRSIGISSGVAVEMIEQETLEISRMETILGLHSDCKLVDWRM
ncbi:hypothetical protein CRG98_006140, partial [Punica granatum]